VLHLTPHPEEVLLPPSAPPRALWRPAGHPTAAPRPARHVQLLPRRRLPLRPLPHRLCRNEARGCAPNASRDAPRRV